MPKRKEQCLDIEEFDHSYMKAEDVTRDSWSSASFWGFQAMHSFFVPENDFLCLHHVQRRRGLLLIKMLQEHWAQGKATGWVCFFRIL